MRENRRVSVIALARNWFFYSEKLTSTSQAQRRRIPSRNFPKQPRNLSIHRRADSLAEKLRPLHLHRHRLLRLFPRQHSCTCCVGSFDVATSAQCPVVPWVSVVWVMKVEGLHHRAATYSKNLAPCVARLINHKTYTPESHNRTYHDNHKMK